LENRASLLCISISTQLNYRALLIFFGTATDNSDQQRGHFTVQLCHLDYHLGNSYRSDCTEI